MRIRVILVLAALLLSGCASVEDPDATEIPDPIYGTGPDGNRTTGYLHIAFDAVPAGPNVPTDVALRMVIETTNAVGQHLDGDVIWTLSIDGPKSITRSGDGLRFEETVRFTERGAYQATITATAPRFYEKTITEDFGLDPIPLDGSLVVPINETRGDWFAVNATASHGFSDLGYSCAWQDSSSIQYENASECDTAARWLKDGNRTATVMIDDGHENVTISSTVPVLPLARAAAPTGPPADPQIVDDASETQAPHVNITSGWLASDLDHVYLGLALKGVPDAGLTRGTTYGFTFTPSWNATFADGNATRFRATATLPTTEGDELGSRHYTLEAEVGGSWQDLGGVTGAAGPGNDLFWWPVPRATIQAPLEASISSLTVSAEGPGGSDSASADGPFALA